MCSFWSTCLMLVISVLYLVDAAPVSVVDADRAPNGKQYLPPLSGYIAVYIRPGDTPLEDINTDLAEAFRYYNRQNFVSVGRSLNDIQSADQTAKLQYKKQRNVKPNVNRLVDDVAANDDIKRGSAKQQEKEGGSANKQHIQKIPKET